MNLTHRCACGKLLEVPASRAGARCRCPACKAKFVAPTFVPNPQHGLAVELVDAGCEHCGTVLEVERSQLGELTRCGACGMAFVPRKLRTAHPSPGGSPQSQAAPPRAPGVNRPPVGWVKVPLLVSAVSNLAIGLAWVSLCVTAPLGIGLWVLCAFEFRLYGELEEIDGKEAARRAHTMGIVEIVCGLVNFVSLACGIVVLIESGKLERRTSAA